MDVDHRVPLKLHTLLDFEGMCCHVGAVVGRGSNAIVYRGWYPDRLNPEQRHHVLIKELFPCHSQGKIRREAQGGITVEPDAQEFWEIRRRSFLVGNEVHLRLLADHPELPGANLNSFSYNGTLYSVLGYTGGRTLAEELAGSPMDLRRIAQWMLSLLDALEAFHKSGFLHLDISPDNIMLVGSGAQERIFLIDYNSARPLGGTGEPFGSKSGYAAPESEINMPLAIGYEADLYSVAAVFYRCLVGRCLSLEEQLQSKAPGAAESPYLTDAPQTVRSMVGRILRKGLAVQAEKRYRSTGQMRQAFTELIDRIDCVGVTHWALWENGRRSVEEWIRTNPSLRYVTEETCLYPIRLEGEAGQISLTTLLQDGISCFILGNGGMGKTTLLLHTALQQGRRYAGSTPAVFYISLGGWRPGDACYIRNQILMRLRFKREMNTFDSAMHGLNQLLHKPLKSKTGERPAVLLLLDGLNEVQGDMRLLVQEMKELSHMAGVQILVASRNPMDELGLKTLTVAPLNEEDVTQILTADGLLLPKSGSVSRLLRTPLILSLYVQTAKAGKQPDIHSEEELMQAYLDALIQKERQILQETDPVYWQVDAAVRYVLPCIAVACLRTGGTLTDMQLLKVIGDCRRTLRWRTLLRMFPDWIGHSREILGDSQSAEQWYGIIVHSVLWQRLGLLVKDPNGGYSVFHQRIGAYLAQKGYPLMARIRRNRISLAAAAAAAAVCCLLVGWNALSPSNYDEKKTEQVLDGIAVCYSAYGSRLTEIQTLTDYLIADEIPEFMVWYDRYAEAVEKEAELTAREKGYLTQIDALCESGEQVAWSKRPLEAACAKTMITDSSLLMEKYMTYLPLLKGWAQSSRAQTEYPDFPEVLRQLLEADAMVMSKLYHQTCVPHLEGGDAFWTGTVRQTVASVPQSGKAPEESLEKLRDTSAAIEKELVQLAASVRLICREENLLTGEIAP